MSSAHDDVTLPLLGHGGLLDVMAQALTAAGAELRMIDGEQNADVVIALRRRLERVEAAMSLAKNAGWAGALEEMRDPARYTDSANTEFWQRQVAAGEFSEAELEVLAWMDKVRPRG